jgi:hypothetical protein
MIVPWYTAVEPFDPTFGQAWTNYVQWSGLSQLTDVVSLDSSLCPSVIRELEAEDWEPNVHEDGMIGFFRDLDYLLRRVASVARVNILAVVHEPSQECKDAFPDPRFRFAGYDLIGSGMSVLTNCGGFPRAFRNEELSHNGLVSMLARAKEIQAALREHDPDAEHTDCDVWALWRMHSGR